MDSDTDDGDDVFTQDEVYEAIGEIEPARVDEISEHLNTDHWWKVGEVMVNIQDKITLTDDGWVQQ